MRFSGWLAAGLGVWLLLVMAGCGEGADYRPQAIGPEGEVIVVMDSARWQGPVGEALRQELGAYIATLPNPEEAFDVTLATITSQDRFDWIKTRRNIVFAAPLSDSTTEAQFLQNLLSEEAKESIASGSTAAVVPRRDVWRRRQQVVYLTAQTPEALVRAIREDGARLRGVFNDITRERVGREMFDKGRQFDIEETLLEKHGFAVNAQHDYAIAVDTTNFVWLRRILSDTWRSLFIYYEDDADPTQLSPAWILQKRDSLAQEYLQGEVAGWSAIDLRRPLDVDTLAFQDRFAIEMRGLWQMIDVVDGDTIQLGGGGPFLSYAFYDEPTRRLYLIDGMVFAPNYPKREFLRQMEIIAHTFRTQQDLDRAEQDVAAAD